MSTPSFLEQVYAITWRNKQHTYMYMINTSGGLSYIAECVVSSLVMYCDISLRTFVYSVLDPTPKVGVVNI